MRNDVPAALTAAALKTIRTPVLAAHIYNPIAPSRILDVSPYVTSLTVTLPPSQRPAVASLTCSNPNGVISRSSVFLADYELVVKLGYLVSGKLVTTQVGRFWLDTPQRQFSTNPPRDQVILQARDGFKLLAEYHFQDGQFLDLAGLTFRAAIQTLVKLVTIGGAPFQVVFDTDPATTTVLDSIVQVTTAGPSDKSRTAASLLKDVLGVTRLLAFFDAYGRLSVGLKNQQSPAVATFGGALALRRPIYYRDVRRSALETRNWVHVFGSTVYADAKDQANIDDIGRVKYLYVSAPQVTTEADALVRAQQELELSRRFTEQPDLQVPWLPDLERRDLVDIDDKASLHLPRAYYRIEDIRFSYTAAPTPAAIMELGMGRPWVDTIDTDSGSYS